MNKIKQIWSNKWVKFGTVSVIYLLVFVVWTGNLWLLIGLPFIYDYYISKYLDRWVWSRNRALKQRSKSYKKTMEWVESILFAVIAVTIIRVFLFGMYVIPTSSMEKTLLVGDYLYVSKVAYGPAMPNTPLSFPLVHHTMPFSQTKKSFVEWISWPYHRLKGFGHVQRNDAVVFNFPEGDTVVLDDPTANYYDILRQYQLRYGPDRGREALLQQHEIITRPVDKRENYIKRAVALPGDTLQVIHSDVFVNGQPQSRIPNKQYVYFIRTDGTMINPQALEDMGIAQADINYDAAERTYIMPLTEDNLARISKMRNVTDVVKYEAEGVDPNVFPQSPGTYPWNADNFGPLWIPSKGATVQLTEENLPLYRRIIEIYEGNSLEVKNGVIYINGKPASKYTFGMDYYFMMGDNRHNSADSRFWGFVPEDHIVGKASVVLFSTDKEKKFLKNIRWDRMFTWIK